MARSRVKSKPQEQVGPQNLSAQREEFRLLAGEWATGHKVSPPPLLSGEDLEKWNAKLDDYVDMFISNLRSGQVEKNFVKRIPTEIKKEIDEATRADYPGASSDLTNRRTQKEKSKKVEPSRKSPTPNSVSGTAPQDNTSNQESPVEESPAAENSPPSKFQKFGAAVQKFKAGFKSFGKAALSETGHAITGAIVNRTEASRNLILAGAAIKSVFGSKTSAPTNTKETNKPSLIDRAFEQIHGKTPEESSMKKAAAEETSGENTNKEVLDVLKRIEENTRSGKKEDKKEDSSPRGKLASAISAMISMLSSGMKGIIASLAPLVAGLASKLKEGFGKALDYAKGKMASRKTGGATPDTSVPDLDMPDGKKKPSAKKTLPPRDPKTGRFITKKAAEELAKQKVPPQSVMQKALSGAKNIGAKSVSALKSAGTAITKTPLTGMAKGLGVVGAGIDVASGMGDLLEGKSQETLEGMDYLSPMRVGMYVGDKINKGVEAVSGGSSIGSLTYDAADSFSGSKIGNWFGLKSDAQKQQEAEKIAKESIAAKKAAKSGNSQLSPTPSETKQSGSVSNVEVKPKLDQASQIIAATPKESGTEAVVQASTQTAESVQKLAASVQNMSKTVVQKSESSSSIVMRNSARDHDSTFRRYLFDRAVFA